MKIVRLIMHEFEKAIVPMIFFFMIFHLAAVTKTLTLDAYKITPTGIAVSTVFALIVAKAVLIADQLPFINLFSGKPLIFSVLWKTAIYAVLCFVFRCIEELIPLISKHGSFGTAVEHFISEVSWPHFWALLLWLIVALILYNAVTELDKHLGVGNVRKAFLGV